MDLIMQAKNVTKASAEKLRSPRKLARSKDSSETTTTAPSGMFEIRDPTYEQARQLWEEWKLACSQPNQSEKVIAAFLAQLQHRCGIFLVHLERFST